jgi:hypothetical protein
MIRRVRPATAIALLALFFALGGSAAALTTKAASPQPRCAQGAVRGIAEVTGQPTHGAANIPDKYTADPSYLGRRFNCSGRPIQVRRADTGTFFVKFVGNAGTSALASAMGPDPAGATVARQPDGSFQVIIGSHQTPEDESFTIVVF